MTHHPDRSSRQRLAVEPLSAVEFAPFGDLLCNDGPLRRRVYHDATQEGEGPGELLFSVSHVKPLETTPVLITQLERHPYSAQTFVPLKVSRWLVVVAPALPDGSPDATRIRAFLAAPGQGISYRQGTWHQGTTVLDTDAQFAVLMWRRTANDDNELYDLREPIEIDIANCSINGDESRKREDP